MHVLGDVCARERKVGNEGKPLRIGKSAFEIGNPTLVLLAEGITKLLDTGAEPDGSTSHGETLLCLETSRSSHLT